MNCQFTIEKQNLPDTKIILISYIEDTFSLKIHNNVDKIYAFDKNQTKTLISENSLEDLKDSLPEIIKIEIEKQKYDKEDMNLDQINSVIDEIEFGSLSNIPRDVSMMIGKNDENEVFSKLIECAKYNNVVISAELDSFISKKPYYMLFIDLFKWITDFKTFAQNLVDKNKIIESNEKKKTEEVVNLKKYIEKISDEFLKEKSHIIEENRMLQNNYIDLKKSFNESSMTIEKLKLENSKLEQMKILSNTNSSDDIMLRQKLDTMQKKLDEQFIKQKQYETMINKFEKSYYADVMNNNYMPSSDFSLMNENIIADFYNHIVFQTKHNFINQLTMINDFLDSNCGMVNMILEGKKYKSINNLVKIDPKKLESSDIKEKCEVFSMFIQNVLNILE